MKKSNKHIKVSSTNVLCSESKRPAGYWRPHKQKIFVPLPLITFIKNISKKTFITYKKQEAKFFCSESNGSQSGFHYR